jgi:hypothetical protein
MYDRPGNMTCAPQSGDEADASAQNRGAEQGSGVNASVEEAWKRANLNP